MADKAIEVQTMWDMEAGGFCGVFVPRHVMHKLAVLTARHQENVRALLTEHMDELLPSNWMINRTYKEDGKQITVRYYDPSERSTVADRVKLFTPTQPRKVDVYFCTRAEAEEIAREIAISEALKESTNPTT